MPTHEQIAKLAYEKWERAGKPAYRDYWFWMQAWAQLNQTPTGAAQ